MKPSHRNRKGSRDKISVYSVDGNEICGRSIGVLPCNADYVLRGHKKLIAIKIRPHIKIITIPHNDCHNMGQFP